MQDGRKGIFKHFLLPESYQQHVPPAQGIFTGHLLGLAEQDVPAHLHELPDGQGDRKDSDSGKQDGGQHIYWF